MRVGLALPHYSDHCTHETLLHSLERIEEYGFDGVWVRDHLGFEAKKFDPPGNRFIDPFVTLSAVASRTERLTLGFAVLIPNRHPLTALQMLASLDWLSGGRVELGVGVGAFGKQFEAVGISPRGRVDNCEDTLALIRSNSPGSRSFSGRSVAFDDLCLEPPIRSEMTIWYGSLAPAALSRALSYCDGVLASRCTFDAYDAALAKGTESLKRDLTGLKRASEPLIVISSDSEKARAVFAERYPFGQEDRRDPRHLSGAVVVGDPDECVAELRKFDEAGFENVILDPRLCMDDFSGSVDLLGREVLPNLSP